MNEDTYEGQITNPLSQNLYTYVGNNPLIRKDPTGHDWLDKLSGFLNGVSDDLTFGLWTYAWDKVYTERDADYSKGYNTYTKYFTPQTKEQELALFALMHSQGFSKMKASRVIDELMGDVKFKFITYDGKHFASKNVYWKNVVESTKNGPAKYKYGTNVEKLERKALEQGVFVNNGKPWVVYEFDDIIGAKNGVETPYIRVEISSDGTVHSHPITPQEYKKYTK